MSANEIKDFENYYKRIGFSKEDCYYSMKLLKKKNILFLAHKLIGKMPDPHNTKEHYQSFINTTSVKQSKIITYQPKAIESPNNVDI